MAHTPFFNKVKKLMSLAAQANKAEERDDGLGKKPWTRRQFLRTTAQTAALAGSIPFLNACDMFSGSPKTKPMDIAIVGAGLAGLNAARHLKRAGYKATIYEASKRPGGRVLTGRDVTAPGLTVELGAEFIDTSHADILELVKEFNLELMDCHAPSEKALKGEGYFFGGRIRTTEEVVAALRPIAERIAQDAEKLNDTSGNALSEFDKLSLAQYFDSIGAKGWIRDLLDVAMVTEMGSETADQTALNVLWIVPTVTDKEVSLLGTSDERYKVRGGNERIVDGLVAGLQGQIRLETPLESVRQSGNKYTLAFKGLETEADAVIIALPFTILRRLTLEAPLDPVMRTFIQEMGYGTNAKVLAGFTRRVWREHGYVGALYSDDSFQLAWDNSQMQPGTAGGFTFFSGGRRGIGAGQGTPEHQARQSLAGLEKIYPGMMQTLNGKFSRFHWPSYPYSQASYSCYKPGQYTRFAKDHLYEEGASHAVGTDNLLFAGEHLSSEFQGFMNGAAQTGRLAAQALLRNIQ